MTDKTYRRDDAGDGQEHDDVSGDSPSPDLLSLFTKSESLEMSRRTFLKSVGFSVGAAMLSACSRGPMGKVFSSLSQPEEITPGKAYWYASTCAGCPAGCAALVKNRDGRPLKLEGNAAHPLFKGGLCAVGQASVLELYDDHRLRGPRRNGQPAVWNAIDREIHDRLASIRSRGGAVRILSGSLLSPTLAAWVSRFLEQQADGKHVVYDALSASALLDAYQETYGLRIQPHYRFDRARVIVSFDADFLGTWISPVEFAAAYRAGRRLEGDAPRLSRHVQMEGRLSLTGSNADERLVAAPEDIPLVMTEVAQRIADFAGASVPWTRSVSSPVSAPVVRRLARDLWNARKESLVVCGLNDPSAQLLAAYMNHLLGNEGTTVDLDRPARQRQGGERGLMALRQEMLDGKVEALLVLGCNPLAELPHPETWEKALAKVPLTLSFASHLDETSSRTSFVCPDHHFLESWGDAEPVSGTIGLLQPAIAPLGDTRAAMESLARWCGEEAQVKDLLKDYWRREVFPRRRSGGFFEGFWNQALLDGYATIEREAASVGSFQSAALKNLSLPRSSGSDSFTVQLYPAVAMLEGRHAQNPWLQELPDPVTKIVWDNYASLSPEAARRLGLKECDVMRLRVPDGGEMELPSHIQPGQHDRVISIALGYGRQGTERFTSIGPNWLEAKPTVPPDGRVGRNAAPLLDDAGPSLSYIRTGAVASATSRHYALASTQAYHRLEIPERLAHYAGEKRPIVRETTWSDFRSNPSAGNEPEPKHVSLWEKSHRYEGYRWGMAIDLTACIGCSGCVIACQAENNVPVVGKDEVARRRDMHWIRIDRYYAGNGPDFQVVHQPMLCHQCGNAPCETVCPVLATMHSSDGLNQQVYNRCVGTRYCENNCPYKVRRFNWFAYQKEGRLSNLALNPDVTIRTRGVMEKCSFCVQRIQEARLEAKRRGILLKDGDIQPACAQSCPTQAIVFGDLNDPKSRVTQLRSGPRSYRVFAELNVDPAVGYLVKVRQDGEGV